MKGLVTPIGPGETLPSPRPARRHPDSPAHGQVFRMRVQDTAGDVVTAELPVTAVTPLNDGSYRLAFVRPGPAPGDDQAPSGTVQIVTDIAGRSVDALRVTATVAPAAAVGECG